MRPRPACSLAMMGAMGCGLAESSGGGVAWPSANAGMKTRRQTAWRDFMVDAFYFGIQMIGNGAFLPKLSKKSIKFIGDISFFNWGVSGNLMPELVKRWQANSPEPKADVSEHLVTSVVKSK
jgi:hypothetical protein